MLGCLLHCTKTLALMCWKLCVLSQALGFALLLQCLLVLLLFISLRYLCVLLKRVADGQAVVGNMRPLSAMFLQDLDAGSILRSLKLVRCSVAVGEVAFSLLECVAWDSVTGMVKGSCVMAGQGQSFLMAALSGVPHGFGPQQCISKPILIVCERTFVATCAHVHLSDE